MVNYSLNTCPICGLNGGILPYFGNSELNNTNDDPFNIYIGDKFIKGLHYCDKPFNKQIKKPLNKQEPLLVQKQVPLVGVPIGVPLVPMQVQQHPLNNFKKYCNAKFSTKKGFCDATGQSIYGGRCGRHKHFPPDIILNHDDSTVI